MRALRRRYGRTHGAKTGTRTIHNANPSERSWVKHNFVFAFGAYGDTLVRAWGRSLDDALDEAIDWLVEHKPGLLATKDVNDEYSRLIEEGELEEDAIAAATVDTTSGGNAGDYINSSEWTIVVENPTRAQILEIQGRK